MEALGHNWGEPVYSWNETEEGWTCTASVSCLNDSAHVESETAAAVYEETLAPTYLEPGAAKLSASFTDPRFAAQEQQIEIDPLEPVVVTLLPGVAGDAAVPGEPVLLSTADRENWSVSGTAEFGKFFEIDGQLWFCFPTCGFDIPEGYHFLGWVSATDPIPFTPGTSYTLAETTYTAAWAPEYKITGEPMGDIAEWRILPETAGEGETVSIMIQMPKEKLDAGYYLEKILVTDPDGNLLEEITQTVSGKLFTEGPMVYGELCYYNAKFVMPASDVVLTAVFHEPHDCKISQFVDLEAYPYGTSEHAAIEWAFTHTPQITAGTDETHFTPEKELNRATAMTFLWAAAGKPNPKSTTSPFSDVKMGKWYTKAILWAAENKITSGNTDGSFGIKTTCNRGHILTFLYAQQGKPEYSIENPYSDVGNKWYTHGAIWAYENGIEKGENGKFNYKTPCTRVMAVTYIFRAVTGEGLVK